MKVPVGAVAVFLAEGQDTARAAAHVVFDAHAVRLADHLGAFGRADQNLVFRH